MPYGNSPSDVPQYQEVHELTVKYSYTSDVIWLGDLNGSFQ